MTRTTETSTAVDGVDVVAQLAELLVQTSWRLRRAGRKELAPLGVTFAQARVLRVLTRLRVPVRMADLSAQLEIVPRSVTSTVDSLEDAGLVTREVDPADRRSTLVALTMAGRGVLDRVDAARRRHLVELVAPLSEPQRAQLLALLSRLGDPDGASPGAGGR